MLTPIQAQRADLGILTLPGRATRTPDSFGPSHDLLIGPAKQPNELSGVLESNDFEFLSHNPKRQRPVHLFHRLQHKLGEQTAEPLPKRTFTAQALPGLGEKRMAKLLDLVEKERQHHQNHQHDAQVLLAVAEIMFEVIALVLERVECFVFDLPTGPTGSHDLPNGLFVQRPIGDPTERLDARTDRAPIFQHVDQHVWVRLIDSNITKPTKIMLGVVFFGNAKMLHRAIFETLLDLAEEVFVVRGFGYQDEVTVGCPERLDHGSFGGEVVGRDRHFQLGVILAELFDPTLHGVLFAVVFGLSILLRDRFGHEGNDFFFLRMDQRSTQRLMIICRLSVSARACATVRTMDRGRGKILDAIEGYQVGVFDGPILGQNFGPLQEREDVGKGASQVFRFDGVEDGSHLCVARDVFDPKNGLEVSRGVVTSLIEGQKGRVLQGKQSEATHECVFERMGGLWARASVLGDLVETPTKHAIKVTGV